MTGCRSCLSNCYQFGEARESVCVKSEGPFSSPGLPADKCVGATKYSCPGQILPLLIQAELEFGRHLCVKATKYWLAILAIKDHVNDWHAHTVYGYLVLLGMLIGVWLRRTKVQLTLQESLPSHWAMTLRSHPNLGQTHTMGRDRLR